MDRGGWALPPVLVGILWALVPWVDLRPGARGGVWPILPRALIDKVIKSRIYDSSFTAIIESAYFFIMESAYFKLIIESAYFKLIIESACFKHIMESAVFNLS